MKCKKEWLRLYAVTDRAWTGRRSLCEQVESALRALCRRYGVPFVVDDDVDIALACGADGIHVGQTDLDAGEVRRRVGEGMLLGVSVHTAAQAAKAVEDGADYLGLGAVFPAGSKDDAEWMPPETLRAICAAADVPAVAIGGIHAGNIREPAAGGVDGAAMISAIFSAPDIEAACRTLRALAEEVFP